MGAGERVLVGFKGRCLTEGFGRLGFWTAACIKGKE